MALELVLASASPRRREILSYLKLPFMVQPADVDETPLPGESPSNMVLRLSRAKAAALSDSRGKPAAVDPASRHEASPAGPRRKAAGAPAEIERHDRLGVDEKVVIAADTTVALDDLIIGKPTSAADAEFILRQLNGRMHQVFTGLTLGTAGGRQWSALCETRVYMRRYDQAELVAYVASGEVYDKAGAYAIQDALFHPVERIEGCYLNVMGLPLCEVINGLQELGIEIDATEPVAHDTLGVS